MGLQELSHAQAQDLPYGAKKRLELAMALAGHATGLLLLDEPAAGLAAAERAELMALVKSLTRSQTGRPGMAVLYTEHNMDAVFGVADRVLVLIDGMLAARAAPTRLPVMPRCASAIWVSGGKGPPMLDIQRLRAWYGQAQALFGVSLTVGPGEMVVLQGLNGAGKSTLLQAIMDIWTPCRGRSALPK